jgi:uncharacterized membrane protein YccC
MFRGVLSGLFAGIGYGIVLMIQGDMPMYGSLIADAESVFGWAVLLAYVACIGALFGIVFRNWSKFTPLLIVGGIAGLVAGGIMAFFIMPVALDMPLQMSLGAFFTHLLMLVEYALFGVGMGLCFYFTSTTE